MRIDAFTRVLQEAGNRVQTQREGALASNLTRGLSRLFPRRAISLADLVSVPSLCRKVPPGAVVIATFPPTAALLAGLWLGRRDDIHLVVDFRDAWARNPYLAGGISLRIATFLERRLLARADQVLVVASSRSRFLAQQPKQLSVVPNGVHHAALPPLSDRGRPPGSIELVHLGNVYGARRSALVELEELHDTLSRARLSPAIHQIGRPWRDPVRIPIEHHGPLPHAKALELASRHDVALLISGTKYDVPTKVYDYVLMGLPIVVLGPRPEALQHTQFVELSREDLAIGSRVLEARQSAQALAARMRALGTYDRDAEIRAWYRAHSR